MFVEVDYKHTNKLNIMQLKHGLHYIVRKQNVSTLEFLCEFTVSV